MNFFANENKDEIKIPPVGLVNFSRVGLKIKNKSYKHLIIYNSCYMNASIQCLIHLDEFVRQILKCDKGDLTEATKNLIYYMKNNKNKNRYCSVIEIKQVMGKKFEQYKGDEQRDANEFITNYLNVLTEETKDSGEKIWSCVDSDKEYFDKFYGKYIKRKGRSLFLEIFYGLERTEEYCKSCSYIFSIKFNPFNILEIPLKKEIYSKKSLKVMDLLKDYISERNNPNEICSKCKKRIKYKTSFNSLPKCLIINFLRDYTDDIQNKIDIPLSLNLNEFLYDKSQNNHNNNYYHLKGIIFYQNNDINKGHYKATCLVNNENWYYFDDHLFDVDHQMPNYEYENPTFLFYEK
jgi:ubiquitin C-terminal hydrolase